MRRGVLPFKLAALAIWHFPCAVYAGRSHVGACGAWNWLSPSLHRDFTSTRC